MSDLGESLDLAAYEIEKRDQQIESEREKSRQLKIAVDKATDLIESLTRDNKRLQDKCLHLEIAVNKRENSIAIETKKLTIVTEALEYYASVNRDDFPGNWVMKKAFLFNIIEPSDLDQAHYEDRKYKFGGKRAREALTKIKGGG